MKPRKLSMQAFGAYLAKTEVDFTPLFESRLFLITGPTGCGKTSILDAMSFALYGRATGSVRDVRDMRNTAAPKATDTEVSFEFELDNQYYKFDRSIHIHEKKIREGGTEDTVNNEAACYEYDGSNWQLTGSSTNGVREKAEQLLGFSYEQFSQVVVLPQGEFRRLLTASSTEKQKILEALFGMQRWQLFVKAISEKSKNLEVEMKELTLKRDTILGSTGALNIAELSAIQQKSAEQFEVLQSELKTLNTALDSANVIYNNAVKIAEHFAEQEQCSNTLSLLMAGASENQKKINRLKLAQKADKLLPFARAELQAAGVLQLAAEKLLRIQLEEKAASLQTEQAEQAALALDSLNSTLTKLAAEAERLQAMHGTAESINTALMEKKKADGIFVAVEHEYTALKMQLETCKQQQSKTLESIDQIIKLFVMPYAALTQRKIKLESLLELKIEYADLKANEALLKNKREKKLQEYQQTEQKLKAAKASFELMQQAEKQDKAWHLAQALEDGTPCPVCGAVSHPKPAQPQAGVPNKATMDAQQNIIKDIEEAFEFIKADGTKIRTQLDNAASQLKQLESKIAAYEDITLEAAKAELADVTSQIKISTEKQKEQKKLEADTELLKEKVLQTETQLAAILLQKNDLQKQIDITGGRLEQLYADTTEEMRDVHIINNRISKVTIEREKGKAAISQITKNLQAAQTNYAAAKAAGISAQETLSAAQTRKAQTAAELEKKAIRLELDKNADVQAITLSDAQQETLQSAIEAYDRNLHSITQRLEQLSTMLSGIQKPNTEDLKNKTEQLRQAVEQSSALKGSLEFKIASYQKASLALADIAELFDRTKQQYEISFRIYRLVNGENALKTPIHQFILGLMLDDILSAANQHLTKLSRGQYTLIRNEEIGRGGGTKGLDLSVNDAWRGGARSVNTLSGGEMFLASLSLAFGLADVVQSYSGGIRLDSIFIDEGFGSLDNETLEIAMQALQYIRSAGRLIGIISHVNELKERIPAHIEVTKGSDGTSSVCVRVS
jgi:exonuclease SbcC